MAKPITVLTNWPKMKSIEMAAFAHNIASKISDSGTFPDLPVSSKNLDAAANRLELAFANRMNGAEAKAEYDAACTALDDLLRQEAAYVNTIANGDAAIIASSGFTATNNERKRATVPAAPNAPSVSGNASELHLTIPAVPGARNYCWVIFTGDAATATVAETHIVLSGAAIVIPDGTTREVLRGIVEAGTKITVQVLAQNAAGKSGFSTAVTFTVGS